jgi:putative acetyltransferase
MNIRLEQTSDIEQIWAVNVDAFTTDVEANLVNTLRDSGCPFVSMVAEEDNQIVGHILFTPVELSGDSSGSQMKELKLMGLAPMAVSSECQKKGVGSQLVKAGLEYCSALDVDAVVVLGHPDYYPKFGFVPSATFGIKTELDVPEEVFMAQELRKGCLDGKEGTIKFHKVFAGV